MNTALECIPCFVRQAAEAMELCAMSVSRRARLMRRILLEIGSSDWSTSPPALAQRLHCLIREASGKRDPYRKIKLGMNHAALNLLPALSAESVRRRVEPPEAAVRLAIAGNLLDSGSKTGITHEELPGFLHSVWDRPLKGGLKGFFRAARVARKILYLTDNAGEIVFDRLLVESLPAGKITVAVRGRPIINDATISDAKMAGMPPGAEIIDNGSDAPGTILDDCSEKFRRSFEEADMIISKGQGNYESLSDERKNIFFLLVAKCPMVAAALGARVGEMILRHQNLPKRGSLKKRRRGKCLKRHAE